MADIRLEKLANLIVNYSVGVRPGDKVVIQGPTLSEPFMRAVFAKVLQASGHPLCQPSLSGGEELMYRYGSDEQLRHVPEPARLIMNTYDCRISIVAEENTKSLSDVDPAKTVVRSRAREELTKTFLRRSASGELRWVVVPYPTNALAQDAEMSLSDYEDFVYAACMPDQDDPVGYWHRLGKWQQGIVDWLKDKKRIHVIGKDTDLTLSIAGRSFISCHGNMNMPDGEVFTGPVEDSIEGFVYFSYPAIFNGREVTGVHLWFEKGEVVRAEAERNGDFLVKTLATDPGAKRVGEFAIGTNEGITRFTREILFDEKIGGSFHIALGSGYPETGSLNESSVHWDMVCDLRNGGEIRVDDTLLYQNGKFVLLPFGQK